MTEAITTEQPTTESFVSPKDLAEAWGTDPKSVRRFLRGLTTNRAGKGGRWEISTTDVEALTEAWNSKGETKRFVPNTETDVEEQDAVELEDELEDEIDLEDIDEL